MATYALTVSTNALGLGVISSATVVVERKRTTVTDIYPTSSLYIKKAATNASGIATIQLEADDGSVFHEVKIFDTDGVLVYKNTIQMPPQAADIDDLPLNDIITESAYQAVQAKDAAQTSATNAANSAAAAAISATNASNSASAASTSATNAAQTAADRVQTGLDVVSTANSMNTAAYNASVAQAVGQLITNRGFTAHAATTAALPSNTYSNGTAGVGATITATANAALAAQDGVTLTAGQILFVQYDGLKNGWYTVTQVGSVSTPFILTRHTSVDDASELNAACVLVTGGNIFGGWTFVVREVSPTVGTTALTFNAMPSTVASVSAVIAPLNGVLSQKPSGIGGFLKAFIDNYGRISAGIKNTGQFYIGNLSAKLASITTATISSLTVTGARIIGASTSTVSTRYTNKVAAKTDNYGRLSYAEREDGTIQISKLRDAAGDLVYPQITDAKDTADSAYALAATGGASALKQELMAAFAKGFYPIASATPTVTLGVANAASVIAGGVFIPMTAVSSLRYLYGDVGIAGDTYPDTVCYKWASANYGAGYVISNGGAVEFEYTGQKLEIKVLGKGYGSYSRILYQDLPNGKWKTTTITTIPNNTGSFYFMLVDFGSTGTRRIRWEHSGHYFAGIQRESTATLSYPTDTDPPKVVMMGDSFIEGNGSSGACTGMSFVLGRMLGLNMYSSGVGGTGVTNAGGLNPSGGQKVNYQDRYTDITSVSGIKYAIIWQTINDSADTQTAQHDGLVTLINNIRGVLPTLPIVIIGMTWTRGTVLQNVYKMRDAGRQVATEYGCYFIDSLDPHCLTGDGYVGATTGVGNSDYYCGSDGTHPSQAGHDYRGQLLGKKLRTTIMTEF